MVAEGGGELGAKEVFAIHKMDGFAFAERGFQLRIICFPRNYLRIRAAEVRVNNHLTGVRDEHLADVREAELGPRRRCI